MRKQDICVFVFYGSSCDSDKYLYYSWSKNRIKNVMIAIFIPEQTDKTKSFRTTRENHQVFHAKSWILLKGLCKSSWAKLTNWITIALWRRTSKEAFAVYLDSIQWFIFCWCRIPVYRFRQFVGKSQGPNRFCWFISALIRLISSSLKWKKNWWWCVFLYRPPIL